MKNRIELNKLSINELQDELLAMRKEQFNLRMKKSNGQLDKTHLVKGVRRTIARIKTIMTQKAGISND